jgi:hypothetical protein
MPFNESEDDIILEFEDNLILEFLHGRIPQESKRGRQAHEALFNLLLDYDRHPDKPIRPWIREALWYFFAPGKPKKFEIKEWKPTKGQKLKEIAEYMCLFQLEHGGRGMYASSVAAAAKEFSVSQGLAKHAWTKYREYARAKVNEGTTADGQYLFIRTHWPPRADIDVSAEPLRTANLLMKQRQRVASYVLFFQSRREDLEKASASAARKAFARSRQAN